MDTEEKGTQIRFRMIDVGRDKWNGEVVAQSEQPEHVEHALLREARKHLRSKDIDFEGDTESGFITVGGFRAVGRYERTKATGSSGEGR